MTLIRRISSEGRKLYQFWSSSTYIHQKNLATIASSAVTVAKDDGPDGGVNVAVSDKKKSKKKRTLKESESAAKKASKSLSQTAQIMLDHVDKHCGNNVYSNLLPKQSLKSTTVIPTSLYLIDEKEAQNIGKAIKLENPDVESPVVELHAGLGLLTSELVNEIGFKNVTCFEDNIQLAENLISRFNVSVVDCGVDDLPRHHHLDKHDGGERINSMLSSIATGKEDEGGGDDSVNTSNLKSEKQLYIIGAVPHVSTINFLIRSYVTKRLFFEDDLPWSGVTLFIALGAKAAHICTATPESGLVAYRPTSVFFQTLFTVKDLGRVPRKAFIPWETEDLCTGQLKRRKMKVQDSTVLRLLRVEINPKTRSIIGNENLFAYWYFVRQHFYARTHKIIPELEHWIPGCGVRLIKQGFTIFTQFGSLKPEQVLDLYLQFVSWPEFANSSFLSALEKFQARLELTDVDDENK